MFNNPYALEPGMSNKKGDTYERYYPMKDSIAKAQLWDAWEDPSIIFSFSSNGLRLSTSSRGRDIACLQS